MHDPSDSVRIGAKRAENALCADEQQESFEGAETQKRVSAPFLSGGNMDLKQFFNQHPEVAIAFSGGVDSAYLLSHTAFSHNV